MDSSPPGSSVQGILQARILEWVAIPFSRGSSWPRDWTQVSCTAGRFFTIWATGMSGWMNEWASEWMSVYLYCLTYFTRCCCWPESPYWWRKVGGLLHWGSGQVACGEPLRHKLSLLGGRPTERKEEIRESAIHTIADPLIHLLIYSWGQM